MMKRIMMSFCPAAAFRAVCAAAVAACVALLSGCSGSGGEESMCIRLEDGEHIWGGLVKDGSLMPYESGFSRSLTTNRENQGQGLLVTDCGRYVWSDGPFTFMVSEGKLRISSARSGIKTGIAGGSLADACRFASENFFPADGKMPPAEFFTSPQYNTWIELMYDQNQQGVLDYARGILENGLPAGIIMIDDTWQEDYGKWEFNPRRFPDPKAMVESLHEMGFNVMLWICPFVSMDQYLICSEINSFKGFLLSGEDGSRSWEEASLPYPVRWWNGTSAVLDFSNERSVEWFRGRLDYLTETYGIDGFKFDAGDYNFYPADAFSKGGINGNEQCRLFAEIGLSYPYNEYRACWQMAGRPLVQRLHDKAHSWDDLQKLVPEMLAENILGYSFSCPDMVGGGSFSTFLSGDIDRDLIVRSAQCHALMTMMQFSLAPWRVLDGEHYAAVLKAVATRESLMPEILALAGRAAETGEPIMRPLEYEFPHQGYAAVHDQFMLGGGIMVAPVLTPGFVREVVFPRGRWTADDGSVYVSDGTLKAEIDVPLDRIPYFRLQK